MLSVKQIDLLQLVPATQLHAPSPLSHTGLELWSTLLPEMAEPLRAPPLAEDELILHLNGIERLTGRIDRCFQEAVQPGMVFIVPRGTPTEWQVKGGQMLMNLFLTPRLLRQLALETAECDPASIEFVPHIATADPFLAAIGRALLSSVQSRSTNDTLAADTLVHALTAHLLRCYTTRAPVIPACGGRLTTPTLQRVLEYMHTNLGEPMTLVELAAIAHLSPYHFARQFRATVGQPPHRYLLDQRLMAARQMYSTGVLSPAMIAATLGFADQSHLNRHFKRRYGLSPFRLARTSLSPTQQEHSI